MISSAWRGDERTPGWLRERGLTAPIIGRTGWAGPTGNRGGEIATWLHDHHRIVEIAEGRINGVGAIEQFVILDDGDDMDDLLPYLVQTDHATGLQDHHVERAITLLRGAATLRGAV